MTEPLTPPEPTKPKGPGTLRAFDDVAATRKNIYKNVLHAVSNVAPLTNDRHTLRLSNAEYIDPEDYSKKEQKDAILTNQSLSRRIRGTWELLDNITGKVIDTRHQVVARVPYWSQRGTTIDRGNEYTVTNQQRLLPAIFARQKANGDLESHANITPGQGAAHRYTLDPAKGVFKIKIAQAEMPLLPLLYAMGSTDKDLREAWGDKVWNLNVGKNDATVLRKLKDRLLRKKDLEGDVDEVKSTQKLVDAFHAMKLDPEISKHTLGYPHDHLSKESILAATSKLLRVSRGEEEA